MGHTGWGCVRWGGSCWGGVDDTGVEWVGHAVKQPKK